MLFAQSFAVRPLFLLRGSLRLPNLRDSQGSVHRTVLPDVLADLGVHEEHAGGFHRAVLLSGWMRRAVDGPVSFRLVY